VPATLTTVNAILKEVYEKQIQDQLQSETVGLKRIETTSDGITQNVGGKYVVFPIRIARNAGVGARGENEALPTAGNQGYAAGQVSLKYLYGSVQLTGQTIELADKDFQAFASALQMEMDGLKSDLAKDQNRQFWGTNTGTLATTTTVTTANTFTATNVQYLEVGQIVDVIDGTTLGNATPTVKANGTARTIASIVAATGVVTFVGASTVTTASGDILVRTGNANRELTGLSQIVASSGTLYNINPGTTPQWVSTVDSNGGTLRALSEGLMILQCDRVRQLGSKVSVIFVNLGVRRAYFNLLVQQRRYTNTQEFEGGFTGLAFTTDSGDIPVVVDVDCPLNKMFFLTEPMMKLYRDADWAFMDRDGSTWQRVIGYDAYQATMYTYQEIGTHKRNSHALMSDLTEG